MSSRSAGTERHIEERIRGAGQGREVRGHPCSDGHQGASAACGTRNRAGRACCGGAALGTGRKQQQEQVVTCQLARQSETGSRKPGVRPHTPHLSWKPSARVPSSAPPATRLRLVRPCSGGGPGYGWCGVKLGGMGTQAERCIQAVSSNRSGRPGNWPMPRLEATFCGMPSRRSQEACAAAAQTHITRTPHPNPSPRDHLRVELGRRWGRRRRRRGRWRGALLCWWCRRHRQVAPLLLLCRPATLAVRVIAAHRPGRFPAARRRCRSPEAPL